jgi:hypothetical protein
MQVAVVIVAFGGFCLAGLEEGRSHVFQPSIEVPSVLATSIFRPRQARRSRLLVLPSHTRNNRVAMEISHCLFVVRDLVVIIEQSTGVILSDSLTSANNDATSRVPYLRSHAACMRLKSCRAGPGVPVLITEERTISNMGTQLCWSFQIRRASRCLLGA